MIWGTLPRSPLLEHVPATAVMLDCLGHIFPFISPGTEMDVGQALQPGAAPPCAAPNTCPAVRRHPQSLPGQGGALSLSITFFPQPFVSREPEGARRGGTWGTNVHSKIHRPKLHFLTTNQITTC